MLVNCMYLSFRSILRSQFEKVAEQRKLTFQIVLDAQVPDIFYTDEQGLVKLLKIYSPMRLNSHIRALFW